MGIFPHQIQQQGSVSQSHLKSIKTDCVESSSFQLIGIKVFLGKEAYKMLKEGPVWNESCSPLILSRGLSGEMPTNSPQTFLRI
jgi:hypothetical protein